MKHVMLKTYTALAIALSLCGVQASGSDMLQVNPEIVSKIATNLVTEKIQQAHQSSLYAAITLTTMAYPEITSLFDYPGLIKSFKPEQLSKEMVTAYVKTYLESEKKTAQIGGSIFMALSGLSAALFYRTAFMAYSKHPEAGALFGLYGSIATACIGFGYYMRSSWANYDPATKAPEIIDHLTKGFDKDLDTRLATLAAPQDPLDGCPDFLKETVSNNLIRQDFFSNTISNK